MAHLLLCPGALPRWQVRPCRPVLTDKCVSVVTLTENRATPLCAVPRGNILTKRRPIAESFDPAKQMAEHILLSVWHDQESVPQIGNLGTWGRRYSR